MSEAVVEGGRRRGRVAFAAPLGMVLALWGCDGGGNDAQAPNGTSVASTVPAEGTVSAPPGQPWFREVTVELGLPAPTHSWPDGTYATTEITPGGVAFFDYDNDGRLDI